MQCLHCGHDNPSSARFCAACGANQDLTCSNCGTAGDAGQKFCTDCGHALPPATHTSAGAELPGAPDAYTPTHLAEKILAARHAMHGERKQVTVLFCDVVDSTSIARELGAEAMHELLSDFFRVTLASVHRFEGTVNQFLGDGFMAIFGAPLALEDHAARAARAALAIREAVAEHST